MGNVDTIVLYLTMLKLAKRVNVGLTCGLLKTQIKKAPKRNSDQKGIKTTLRLKSHQNLIADLIFMHEANHKESITFLTFMHSKFFMIIKSNCGLVLSILLNSMLPTKAHSVI